MIVDTDIMLCGHSPRMATKEGFCMQCHALAAEQRGDRWENLVRRLWFFFVSVVPAEWIDETIAMLMKRAKKELKEQDRTPVRHTV